jgi:hypothetical protein
MCEQGKMMSEPRGEACEEEEGGLGSGEYCVTPRVVCVKENIYVELMRSAGQRDKGTELV